MAEFGRHRSGARAGLADGRGCAIGAAWQAKYHRLVALILLGGAGLATCITFAWFSHRIWPLPSSSSRS